VLSTNDYTTADKNKVAALKTAANSDVQTSVTDSTPGRVLTVGAFGLGLSSTPVISNADTTIVAGKYCTPTEWVGSPIPGVSSLNQGYLTVHPWAPAGGGTYLKQTWSGVYADDPAASGFERVRGNTGWNAWRKVFSGGNVVGPVEVTNNLVTGALMEYGTNENGEYWRFANGLQICSKIVNTPAPTTQQGSMYVSAPTNAGSFPKAFVNTPAVVNNGAVNATGYGWASMALFASASTWGSWVLYYPVNNVSGGTLWLTAIGRWR
jgi:hypothetical protein